MRLLMAMFATAFLAIPAAGLARTSAAPPVVLTGDQSLMTRMEFAPGTPEWTTYNIPSPTCDSTGCILYPNLTRTGFPNRVDWMISVSGTVNAEMRIQDPTGADFKVVAGLRHGDDFFVWSGEPGPPRTSPDYAKPGVYRATTTLTDAANPARVLSISFNVVVKETPPVASPAPQPVAKPVPQPVAKPAPTPPTPTPGFPVPPSSGQWASPKTIEKTLLGPFQLTYCGSDDHCVGESGKLGYVDPSVKVIKVNLVNGLPGQPGSGTPNGQHPVDVFAVKAKGMGKSRLVNGGRRYQKFDVQICGKDYANGGQIQEARFVWYTARRPSQRKVLVHLKTTFYSRHGLQPPANYKVIDPRNFLYEYSTTIKDDGKAYAQDFVDREYGPVAWIGCPLK